MKKSQTLRMTGAVEELRDFWLAISGSGGGSLLQGVCFAAGLLAGEEFCSLALFEQVLDYDPRIENEVMRRKQDGKA